MSLLALDIGSSSIKAALLELDEAAAQDASGVVVGPTSAEPFPGPVTGLPPGYFEVAPQPIVAACRRVMERVLAESPAGFSPVTAVVSCGQMGGVILVDRQGVARSNYLSWRDQRAVQTVGRTGRAAGSPSFFDQLRQRLTADDWLNLGRELQPGSALTMLSWLASHQQLDRSGEVGPLSLGDYVWRQLAGGRHGIARTQANGWLNLSTGQLHRDLFERLEIAALNWPLVIDEHQATGTWSEASQHVRREIPVYSCVGDHPCALMGTRLEPGELSINVSTGSQVSRLSDLFQPGPYQTRPYFAGQLLNTITHLPAGRSLNVLIDFMTEWQRASGGPPADPWDYVIDQAQRASEREASERAAGERDASERDSSEWAAGERDVSEGLGVDLAFFAGPLGECGSITGITTENFHVGDLFAAAFESMAKNYDQMAARLCPQRDWSRFVLSGGLIQRVPLLRHQIIQRLSKQPGTSAALDAGTLDCEYRLALSTEETLTGLGQLYRKIAG
ncbi:MAG: sedoheptulokinase [Planctomycetota bacterium]